MNAYMTRREFLTAGLMLLPTAARLYLEGGALSNLEWPQEELLGRIAIASVSVHSKPSEESTILYQRRRDEVINLYEEVISDQPPKYNPRWYRVWRGYIHSARVQIVRPRLNPASAEISEGGVLGEVTVPATFPLYSRQKGVWTPPLYPLYYSSVHWVTGVTEGPDRKPWYRITEAWSQDKYYVPAEHIRLIAPQEYTPLSPEVPAHKKRIEVSIDQQTLRAFEEDEEVFQAKVSTGLNRRVEGEVPWRTPSGEFNILSKMPSQRMGDDPITSDVSGYVLPGVPWVSYFHETGVAIHGTYWHDNYGVPMSHGCVNMRPEDSLWVFRWSTPAGETGKREMRGLGTKVIVG
jgi:lipoprotein-anchoring transpeptidase ErfK/SrfK